MIILAPQGVSALELTLTEDTNFLESSEAMTEEDQEIGINPLGTTVPRFRTTAAVNLREGSGTNFRSIEVVPANTNVASLRTHVNSNREVWHEVLVGGNWNRRGWIIATFLQPNGTMVIGLSEPLVNK